MKNVLVPDLDPGQRRELFSLLIPGEHDTDTKVNKRKLKLGLFAKSEFIFSVKNKFERI